MKKDKLFTAFIYFSIAAALVNLAYLVYGAWQLAFFFNGTAFEFPFFKTFSVIAIVFDALIIVFAAAYILLYKYKRPKN